MKSEGMERSCQQTGDFLLHDLLDEMCCRKGGRNTHERETEDDGYDVDALVLCRKTISETNEMEEWGNHGGDCRKNESAECGEGSQHRTRKGYPAK